MSQATITGDDFIDALWTEDYTNSRVLDALEASHRSYIAKDRKRKYPEHFEVDCHICWLIQRAQTFRAMKAWTPEV